MLGQGQMSAEEPAAAKPSTWRTSKARWPGSYDAQTAWLGCGTSMVRVQAARDLLGSVYERFTEGFATQDLIRVRRLLDELQDKRPA